MISLSPSWFFAREMVAMPSYLGNFSPLHASELAFSTALTFDLKHDAARRMLEYSQTLEGHPLLRFTLHRLADGAPLSRIIYYTLLPLGKLQNLVFGLQDHWETLKYVRSQSGLNPDVARQRTVLDWRALLANADQAARQERDNNPFGLDNRKWAGELHERVAWQKNTHTDAGFLGMLQRAREWTDFDLMLRGLLELGARPLILSMPVDGLQYDYLGISTQARRAYDEKLREAVKPYGVRLIDFADHEYDPYFLIDWEEHLSVEGWMYYAKAMDAFYHDRPLDDVSRAAVR